MGPELLAGIVALVVAIITGGPAWITARKAKSASESAKESSESAKVSSDRARLTSDVGNAAVLSAIDALGEKIDANTERLVRMETWARLHDREHGHDMAELWR